MPFKYNPITNQLDITGTGGGGGGVTTVTGTAFQILATPNIGDVVLSLIGPYTPASYTAHGVLVGEGTSSIVSVSPSTAGFVLTSNGVSADPSFKAPAAASILFTGDNGTPFSTNSVTIYANNTSNQCGSSVLFNASTPNITLQVTDANNNTIIGKGAGMPAITGTDNIALGNLALSSVSTGIQNIAIGSSAGKVNTQQDNVFIGYKSGLGNVNGSENIAIGTNTLQVSGSGSANVCIGHQAGFNMTGGNNVAVGFDSLVSMGGGANNVAVGRLSGASLNSAESGNICIGALVQGFSGDGNSIRIGDTTNVSANSGIRLGTTGTHTTCFIAGISGISVANLNIVTINTTTGQLGSQAVPPSTIAFSGDTGTPFSSSSLKITSGLASLPGTANAGATVLFDASTPNIRFVVTDSNENTMMGQNAGNSGSPITGTANTIFGGYSSGAPLLLSSGYSNCSFGFSAGYITTGFFNCCMGIGSGVSISGANDNTYVGTGAGGTSQGNFNTCLGSSTMDNNTINGSYNIAIGYLSGNGLGNSSDSNIMINHQGNSGDSNTIRIGVTGSGSSQQNKAYVAGIAGATFTAGSPMPAYVIIDTSNDQLIASSTPPSLAMSITSISSASSPYTVIASDQFISVNSSIGVVTIRLPNAPTTGRVLYIKDATGAALTNNISITTVGGSVTIDGLTTYTLNVNYQSVGVIFNGSSYEVF